MSVMEAILDFFTDGFVPRRFCGHWPVWLLTTWIFANAATWLSYWFIPLQLYRLLKHNRPDRRIVQFLLLFIMFIFSCGLGHAVEIVVFWWPAYPLFTMVHIMTAFLSVGTAIVLPSIVVEFLGRPTQYEHEQIHQRLEESNAALREQNTRLTEAKNRLEHMLKTESWTRENREEIRALTTLLRKSPVCI